jgi:hypothetical protein
MTTTAVAELRAKLNKETLRLPPLQRLCSDKSIEISPYYDRLKEVVEARFDEWFTEPDLRVKARELDLAYFQATYVPTSTPQMS